ncbi:hypothetical protein JCM6882_004444 [Rhodosporidiobolus microsporus]
MSASGPSSVVQHLEETGFLADLAAAVERFQKELIIPATLQEYMISWWDVQVGGGDGSANNPFLLTIPGLHVKLIPHRSHRNAGGHIVSYTLPPKPDSNPVPERYAAFYEGRSEYGVAPEFYQRQSFKKDGSGSATVNPPVPRDRVFKIRRLDGAYLTIKKPQDAPIQHGTPPESATQIVTHEYAGAVCHALVTFVLPVHHPAPRLVERPAVFSSSRSGELARPWEVV